MYSQDLPDKWEYFPDTKGYDKLYGLLGFLCAKKAILVVNPYVCVLLSVMISSLANHSM